MHQITKAQKNAAIVNANADAESEAVPIEEGASKGGNRTEL